MKKKIGNPQSFHGHPFLDVGLGKTFIAAVVMYNFYRWYPTGKVIFMAPTKPLVAQQIQACQNIMGFEPEDICEITGTERERGIRGGAHENASDQQTPAVSFYFKQRIDFSSSRLPWKMVGAKNKEPEARKQLWKTKRVFFLTPQVGQGGRPVPSLGVVVVPGRCGQLNTSLCRWR
jgi:hypothetical protein